MPSAIEQLSEVFAGQFMQPVIYFGDYYEVETNNGTEIVPYDIAGKILPSEEYYSDMDEAWPDIESEIAQYVEGKPVSVEPKSDWLARLSAPGYADCTDWTAHETEEGAAQFLIDQYGED
jgi:hypothetical protein